MYFCFYFKLSDVMAKWEQKPIPWQEEKEKPACSDKPVEIQWKLVEKEISISCALQHKRGCSPYPGKLRSSFPP